LDDVRSMAKAIWSMQKKVLDCKSVDSSAWTNFLIGGFQGLLLGPRKKNCSSSAGALHIHLLALAGTNQSESLNF
jgi:hypothetical protein